MKGPLLQDVLFVSEEHAIPVLNRGRCALNRAEDGFEPCIKLLGPLVGLLTQQTNKASEPLMETDAPHKV